MTLSRLNSRGAVAWDNMANVFDAEAIALQRGLADTMACHLNTQAYNLWVCLDNSAVVNEMYDTHKATSSHSTILKAARLL
jgi:hypothetical protein